MSSAPQPSEPAPVTGEAGRRAIVLVGGPGPALPRLGLPSDALVVAADSGLHLATGLGLQVDLVVGDLDSVDPARLEAAVGAGARVDRHPVDKDRTDLALALDAVATLGAAEVTVVGGDTGRLDHLIAGLLLLAAPAYAALTITAYLGPALVTVIRASRELHGVPGDLVSLMAMHGAASGVTTRGLRFPLRDERLSAGSSRGVSNVFDEPVAEVQIASGTLVAIQPETHLAAGAHDQGSHRHLHPGRDPR